MEQVGESLEPAGGEPTLRRSISLWQMTLYGAGGMLGATVCVVMFATRIGAGDWRAPVIAGVLLLGVAALYFVIRRRTVADEG